MLPAKADPDQQKEFLEQEIQPRLDEAREEKRVVYFMDAAHFGLAPFLGFLWSVVRIFMRAPSGWARVHCCNNKRLEEKFIHRTKHVVPQQLQDLSSNPLKTPSILTDA